MYENVFNIHIDNNSMKKEIICENLCKLKLLKKTTDLHIILLNALMDQVAICKIGNQKKLVTVHWQSRSLLAKLANWS